MAQVKAVFYLPRRDNDGRDLRMEIEDVRAELFIRFLAWTFLGYITGAYRMADGTQALDVSAWYAVVLDEARLPELEQVLREFKAKTLQDRAFSLPEIPGGNGAAGGEVASTTAREGAPAVEEG